MASKRSRARRLERERTERRLAKLAQRQRRKRQIQAAVGGVLALAVVGVLLTWALGGFSTKTEQPVTLPTCTWTEKDPSAVPGTVDTGLPPESGEQRSGTEALTISTDKGDITADLDTSLAPCGASSLGYLGSSGFYANQVCSALDTTGAFDLTCGDPAGDGTGGPAYQFPGENIPTTPLGPQASPPADTDASATSSYYAAGTIALKPTGDNAYGSQFVIVYADGSNLPPEYSVVGTVTSGLDIVQSVAAAGATADGKANTPLTIQSLTVGTPATSSADATPEASATS